MIKKLVFLGAILAVAVVAGFGASAAFAGEATGNCSPNTKSETAAANCQEDQNQNSNSICSFSGQNDDTTGTQGEGPGGRVQSYGYSAISQQWDPDGPPHAAGQGNGGVPGDACQGGSN